mgnify:FL=1
MSEQVEGLWPQPSTEQVGARPCCNTAALVEETADRLLKPVVATSTDSFRVCGADPQMSYTTHEGRKTTHQRKPVGRKCNQCNERFFAIEIDRYGRPRTDTCGCEVRVVSHEDEADETEGCDR